MVQFNSNQVFVVTGATSGIGEAVAIDINARGGVVVGIGRNKEAFDALIKKSEAPERLFFEQKDLTEDMASLPEYMEQLSQKYDKLSGIVCSAGITETLPLRAVSFSETKKIFDINFFVPLMMAKGFVQKSVHAGKGSSFVSISSVAYQNAVKGLISYGGSKAALVASMQAIAKEYAAEEIRFNVVSPGDIDTPMTQNIPEIMDIIKYKYPLGLGKPQDVANVVSFLLSDEAQWITGQNYVVNYTNC